MAGERYGDLAAAALRSYCQSNLQTYLTAVETAQSLDAGSMAPPVAYLGSLMSEDGRSPLAMVDCVGGDAESWSDGLHAYDCRVVLVFNSDADLDAGATKARRYLTALVDMIRNGDTLGGTVALAWGGAQDFDAIQEDDAPTRFGVALTVMVRIHEPDLIPSGEL